MKTFADDESYNSGHGHAYSEYGVDPEQGAWYWCALATVST
jgi:phenol 2-monooxygenase